MLTSNFIIMPSALRLRPSPGLWRSRNPIFEPFSVYPAHPVLSCYFTVDLRPYIYFLGLDGNIEPEKMNRAGWITQMTTT